MTDQQLLEYLNRVLKTAAQKPYSAASAGVLLAGIEALEGIPALMETYFLSALHWERKFHTFFRRSDGVLAESGSPPEICNIKFEWIEKFANRWSKDLVMETRQGPISIY